jgi:Ala-tRNA(Pro) deacylase
MNMTMSSKLKRFLQEQQIEYDLEPHPHTEDSSHTAREAHVPGDRLAKAVLLIDDLGSLVAVVPATHRVLLGEVHLQLDRNLGLATESELTERFPDCDPGAIPPVGRAFGMDTVVETSLLDQPEVWFEAGDHESLVHVSGNQFRSLMADARPGHFSTHA